MSDYCDCCSTNRQHIAEHYDPSKNTRPDESPESVLALFRGMFDANSWGEYDDEPSVCPLTLDDVRDYLDELASREYA